MTNLTDPKTFLTDLFRAAIDAADPMIKLPRHLPPQPEGHMIVIGAGKASARMAEALESVYGPCDGIVVTRYGYARPCQGIEILEAAHPVPNEASENATKRILSKVQNLSPKDHVLCLISGGGSALLCGPIDGLTLADKQHLNTVLLASGLAIGEMNIIRKAFSKVKGGGLLEALYPAKVTNFLISDVPGDDLTLIASGPTVPSNSDTQEALALIAKHLLDIPNHMIKAAKRAAQNSANQPTAAMPTNIMIAAPSQSLRAAAKRAEGCDVRILGDNLEGEARDLGQAHAILAQELQAKMNSSDQPILLLSGCECTVTRQGNGIGGPNAEYALSAGITLGPSSGIYVLSGDTDGVDGADEIAASFSSSDMMEKAQKIGLDPELALARNDAHSFFAAMGDQIITGPTLTNVNDFRAILITPPAAIQDETPGGSL